MSVYLIGGVILTIIVVIYMMSKGSGAAQSGKDNVIEENFKGGDLKALEESLTNNGFSIKKNQQYTSLFKQGEDYFYEVEIFLQKRKYKIDIDVKSQHFKMSLPDSISPEVFDRIILAGFNQKLMEEKGYELLTDVNDGNYFLRKTIKQGMNQLPDFEELSSIFTASEALFEDFPFVEKADLENEFFNDLSAAQYTYQLGINDLAVRFQKVINEFSVSIYYSKYTSLLLLVSTPLLEGAMQEDFSTQETRLHQFLKADEAASLFPEKADFDTLIAEFSQPVFVQEEEE